MRAPGQKVAGGVVNDVQLEGSSSGRQTWTTPASSSANQDKIKEAMAALLVMALADHVAADPEQWEMPW